MSAVEPVVGDAKVADRDDGIEGDVGSDGDTAARDVYSLAEPTDGRAAPGDSALRTFGRVCDREAGIRSIKEPGSWVRRGATTPELTKPDAAAGRPEFTLGLSPKPASLRRGARLDPIPAPDKTGPPFGRLDRLAGAAAVFRSSSRCRFNTDTEGACG